MNDKPFTFEEFKEIYSKVPRVTVGIVIKTDKGIVLSLRKLSSWHNMWHMPGATVLINETLHDTARRIGKSELGVIVEVKEFLGYLEYPDIKKEQGFGSLVHLVFACDIIEGTPRPNEDAYEVKAFKKLPENMIQVEKEFIKKLI